MALKGKIENREGKDVFNIEFTNGTFAQLEELVAFLLAEKIKISEEDSREIKLQKVIEVGISWLERIKEKGKKH